ncbi:MAG: phosphoribosyltransferase, partial [Nanoarchaeota archaeon]
AELAMGAIATSDISVFNEDIVSELDISRDEIELVMEKEKRELERREKVYRGNHPFPALKNQIIILTDDGIAFLI